VLGLDLCDLTYYPNAEPTQLVCVDCACGQCDKIAATPRSSHYPSPPSPPRPPALCAGCRLAAYDAQTRREFAARFGRLIEDKYDAVACNFPTWQCALFEHVNVAIIMRFTHRYDHHMQGLRLPGGARDDTVVEEVERVLKRMAAQPNVIVASSNAYDHVYLRRQLGITSVPWPGLSYQLARIPYLGGGSHARREILFCCGAQPYNRAIDLWAETVANATQRKARGQLTTFAWLNDLYPRSWQCTKRTPGLERPSPRNEPVQRAGVGPEVRLDRGRQLKGHHRAKTNRAHGAKAAVTCGYRYEDVAAHPFALLLPYSVHSCASICFESAPTVPPYFSHPDST
jgi:hypothetical protein